MEGQLICWEILRAHLSVQSEFIILQKRATPLKELATGEPTPVKPAKERPKGNCSENFISL